jgi:uncharacterized membrane protein (DUF373 family)
MKIVEKIEKVIVYFLMIMLLIAIILGTIQLGYQLFQIIVQPPFLRIEPQLLFDSFGTFLIIIIGIELVKLLKMHLSHDTLRPELVIEVAIIAVCNKVVTLNLKTLPADSVVGLAVLLLSLAAAYFVFSRAASKPE